MTKGNFDIGWIQANVSIMPKGISNIFPKGKIDAMVMGENNIGHCYAVSEADAKRMAKKIEKFKKELKDDVRKSNERFMKSQTKIKKRG